MKPLNLYFKDKETNYNDDRGTRDRRVDRGMDYHDRTHHDYDDRTAEYWLSGRRTDWR